MERGSKELKVTGTLRSWTNSWLNILQLSETALGKFAISITMLLIFIVCILYLDNVSMFNTVTSMK